MVESITKKRRVLVHIIVTKASYEFRPLQCQIIIFSYFLMINHESRRMSSNDISFVTLIVRICSSLSMRNKQWNCVDSKRETQNLCQAHLRSASSSFPDPHMFFMPVAFPYVSPFLSFASSSPCIFSLPFPFHFLSLSVFRFFFPFYFPFFLLSACKFEWSTLRYASY